MLGAVMRRVGGVVTGIRRNIPRRGLDEFFDPAPASPMAGRRWNARDLRRKSNTDLHKLWYVLLKERNMLNTMRHEARRVKSLLPALDRVRKVRKGMGAIKQVIGERDRAVAEYYEEMNETPELNLWEVARQVVVHQIHCDTEEEEFVKLLEDHGINPVRYELFIARHAKFGHAVIELENKGDAQHVRNKLHNRPFVDGMKIRVKVDKEVKQFGHLSERPPPSDMIMRARILKYKQFPAESDPLRPKSKYKRKTDLDAAFARLEMADEGSGTTNADPV